MQAFRMPADTLIYLVVNIRGRKHLQIQNAVKIMKKKGGDICLMGILRSQVSVAFVH